jgi:hypothetical protein
MIRRTRKKLRAQGLARAADENYAVGARVPPGNKIAHGNKCREGIA